MSTKINLTSAADGLLMMSESDYPFDFLESDATEHNEDLALQLSNREAGTPVSQITVDHLLRNMTNPASGSVSADTAAKFLQLSETLKQELQNISVYRVGDVQVDVLILGNTASGNVAGLKTRLIET